jgi:hypothetical protein
MYAKSQTVQVTTASDGTATAQFPNPVNGRIFTLIYTKPGSGGFSDGSTITITGAKTGQNILTQTGLNSSATLAPRLPTHSTAGVAALYASGGTAVNDHIVLADENVQIAISSGGNAANGTFTIIYG